MLIRIGIMPLDAKPVQTPPLLLALTSEHTTNRSIDDFSIFTTIPTRKLFDYK
ncbi:Unannotated [Lentimonas sp. CC4]|uniref:hypothetical protein n=1 Tax=Lentimonas sp. CC8 TaxID=2676101 RepID=UPI001327F6D4|nr:hypothetical protein [Lentimonas sp. CC8]CAA6679365.1 Unannotated [Lentimonas sp. CC4]CAA6687356.1 Unannotated [Lentimonas sp. CC6]CAA7167998.1 Unannotated [Lentimonas sp. CC21]CAA7078028.1 Unannotated [Lentimonas sp. CC4]CAA7179573.1 Unannotated [Lentimonas sp. CC8]